MEKSNRSRVVLGLTVVVGIVIVSTLSGPTYVPLDIPDHELQRHTSLIELSGRTGAPRAAIPRFHDVSEGEESPTPHRETSTSAMGVATGSRKRSDAARRRTDAPIEEMIGSVSNWSPYLQPGSTRDRQVAMEYWQWAAHRKVTERIITNTFPFIDADGARQERDRRRLPLFQACEGFGSFSKTKPHFKLCLHGQGEVVSSHFSKFGYWRDCLTLPYLAHWAYNASRDRTADAMPTVVEVGGNIGTCALLLASQGAHVTTFEPLHANCAHINHSLQLNTAIQHNVELVCAAAGERPGGSVGLRGNRANFGATLLDLKGRMNADPLVQSPGDAAKLFSGSAPMTSLDSVIHSHVHLLKLDCQGCEVKAVKGATRLFREFGVDVVQFELDGLLLNAQGDTPGELLHLLHELGFLIFEQSTGYPVLPGENSTLLALLSLSQSFEMLAIAPFLRSAGFLTARSRLYIFTNVSRIVNTKRFLGLFVDDEWNRDTSWVAKEIGTVSQPTALRRRRARMNGHNSAHNADFVMQQPPARARRVVFVDSRDSTTRPPPTMPADLADFNEAQPPPLERPLFEEGVDGLPRPEILGDTSMPLNEMGVPLPESGGLRTRLFARSITALHSQIHRDVAAAPINAQADSDSESIHRGRRRREAAAADLRTACNGDHAVSTTRPTFHLCTLGATDVISSHFSKFGYWRDCLTLPYLAHWAYNASRERTADAMPTVVEVGGNIGTCALLLASQGAHVTTFEPFSRTRDAMGRSVALNAFQDRVVLVGAAASVKSGTATVYSEAGNAGNSVIIEDGSTKDGDTRLVGRAVSENVQVVRLDDVIHNHVHLLKLDCQGCELRALQGAQRLFRAFLVDVVHFELDGRLLIEAQSRPTELIRFFVERGYGLYVAVEGELLSWGRAVDLVVRTLHTSREVLAFSPAVMRRLVEQNRNRDAAAYARFFGEAAVAAGCSKCAHRQAVKEAASAGRLALGLFPAMGTMLESNFARELADPLRKWLSPFPHHLEQSQDAQPYAPNDVVAANDEGEEATSEVEQRRQQNERLQEMYAEQEQREQLAADSSTDMHGEGVNRLTEAQRSADDAEMLKAFKEQLLRAQEADALATVEPVN